QPPNDITLCASVIATVPANAMVREFRYQASDENLGGKDCTEGKVCPIGYARFLTLHKTWNSHVTVYQNTFQDWSTDWAREGRMIIFLKCQPERCRWTTSRYAATAGTYCPSDGRTAGIALLFHLPLCG